MVMRTDGTAGQRQAEADEALVEAAFRTGDFAKPQRLFGEVQAQAAAGGDRRAEALGLGGLGMTLHYRNITRLIAGTDPDQAEVAAEAEVLDRALAIWRETGDAAGTAWGLFGVGLVWQVLRGDWDTAMTYFWPAFGLAEALEDSGDLHGCSEIHRHVGFHYLVDDVRPAEAVRRLAYSLSLRERIGDPRRLPSAMVSLGQAELAAGNPARAAGLLERAVQLSRENGLLAWRIRDAGETLREARQALRS
jgi:tetratricopeptide (TPR) repeat protein